MICGYDILRLLAITWQITNTCDIRLLQPYYIYIHLFILRQTASHARYTRQTRTRRTRIIKSVHLCVSSCMSFAGTQLVVEHMIKKINRLRINASTLVIHMNIVSTDIIELAYYKSIYSIHIKQIGRVGGSVMSCGELT